MIRYSFKNDYSEGVHPKILKALSENNEVQEGVYGQDRFCQKARELISEKLRSDELDIHFVTTGTQANLTLISTALRPYESIIAPNTGHIAIHETGAIEAIGHKINTVVSADGKLTPQAIDAVLKEHQDEHMVKPKAVFISNASELGSIYQKKELKALSQFCREKDLYLHLDGARLGAALVAKENDLTFSDIPQYVDSFYIGGTKNGGLLGEAIVIVHPKLKKNFRYTLKQKGALASKSRFLGIQFIEFFKENLYLELAAHTHLMALELARGIKTLGYPFLEKPSTNLIFPIFPNKVIEKLLLKYDFSIWKAFDEGHSSVRLVTSWATEIEAIQEFLKELNQLTLKREDL